MRKQLTRAWLTAAVSGGLFLGCRSASNRPPYPEQPLLLSKTPVEGKIEAVETGPVAQADPVAPPLPADALAAIPKPLPQVPINGPANENAVNHTEPPAPKPSPFHTAVRTKTPILAAPAVRSNDSPTPAPVLSGLGRVSGSFGHGADYAWLQGVIDRHYRGHLCLRYCDPTVEDRWGGKVRLEDDPRLAQFREGDVVVVEGALVPETDSPRQELWKHFPRYRVTSATLIRHRN
jgi:hypothetical protein